MKRGLGIWFGGGVSPANRALKREIMAFKERKAATISIIICLIAAVAVGTAGCSVAVSGEINWLSDWNEAIETARADNKPIMIYFYTDVCPACRHLEANAFSDETLGVFLNNNVVCLESNAQTSTLHNRYQIEQTVPTTVFSAPDAYDKEFEIARVVGSAPASYFLEKAQLAVELVQK